MKQTWAQNHNEIKEAYKPRFEKPSKPAYGEEVVMFQISFKTTTCDYSYVFHAPRCSTREELLANAYHQVESSTLKMMLDGSECYAGYEKNISFRTYCPQ